MPINVYLLELSSSGGGSVTQTLVDTFPNITAPGVVPTDGSSFPATKHLPGQNHVGWVVDWDPRNYATGSSVEE